MQPYQSRLASIVGNLKSKTNKVSTLLQGGKDKVSPEKKDNNHYQMDSNQIKEAELLFGNQIGQKKGKKQKKQKKKVDESEIKSILKSQKPESMVEENDKKQKTVSFYQQGRPIYLVPVDKKWSDTIQNQKKGKFQPHQQKILCDAVGQFLACNEIQFDQFKKIISEGSNSLLRKQKFFQLLSNALPERSPQSCYKYILRQFNTLNHQGPWTQEEIDSLLALVDKYGRKWKLIGKELNRTADNVYDKYRSLGEQGLEQRIKKIWKIRELITLLTLVQNQSRIKFLDPKISDLLLQEEKHDKLQQKEMTTRKYNTKVFVFHNIQVIRDYIDAKILKGINLQTLKWKKIMRDIPSKSLFDCRNKMIQILQVLFRNTQDLDNILVGFLERQNISEQSKIDWKKWHNQSYTPEEAKNRYMIMKKLIEGRSVKSFSTVLQEMRIRLNKKMANQSS